MTLYIRLPHKRLYIDLHIASASNQAHLLDVFSGFQVARFGVLSPVLSLLDIRLPRTHHVVMNFRRVLA